MASKDLEKLVQYTTEKLAAYIEMPSEERKSYRQQRSMRREPWSFRLFGMLPYAIVQWFRSFKRKK